MSHVESFNDEAAVPRTGDNLCDLCGDAADSSANIHCHSEGHKLGD